MPTLRIDNREVSVEDGATILQAARKLGIDVPALCWREGCTPQTSCLACVVKVNGGQRLLPSCATRVAEGMAVESETPEVHAARRMAIELLLADHAGDCLAPCTNICPAHMDIPQMLRLISAGRYHDALVVVKDKIALPAVLGRICPELCEKGCRRAAMDSPVSICSLKRFVADVDLESGQPWLPAVRPASGKRVAIVGAGAAGLAAAWYLQQLGHQCTLFDEHPLPGGNLRYAVPKELLPDDVLNAEIELTRRLGAEFVLNTRIGQQVSIKELQGRFDAVLLTVGEVDKVKATALGVDMAGKGLKVDKHVMMTPLPGVFAAGGAVQPMRHAIRAVREGRDAAHIIDGWLSGQILTPVRPDFTVRLGVLTDEELSIYTNGASDRERSSSHGLLAGLTEAQAVAQADRCLDCDCSKAEGCRLRGYAGIYEANYKRYAMPRRQVERVEAHPHVIWEPGKCIACGLCVQIATRAQEPLGLAYIGRGFNIRVAAPFDGQMSEALKTVAREVCEACPTAALTLREKAHEHAK